MFLNHILYSVLIYNTHLVPTMNYSRTKLLGKTSSDSLDARDSRCVGRLYLLKELLILSILHIATEPPTQRN